MRPITQLAPHEFRFEFDELKQAATLSKGDIFRHKGETYRIVYYKQVFNVPGYYSFLVVAEEVTLQSAID